MPTPVTNLIMRAEECLSAAVHDLTQEMRTYPTPISGCDSQYNHLIAQRNRVQAALAALADTPFVATPRTPFKDAGVESR